MTHVCSAQHVKQMDNALRPLIHNPKKIFGPYVSSGMRVMDTGCGAGFTSIGLAKLVGDTGIVYAVDLQPELLSMVQERAEKERLDDRIVTHQCESNSLNLSGEFDFVNAFWMVHEVPDKKTFLREIHGSLVTGGKLLIVEPLFIVSSEELQKTINLAVANGFKVHSRPRVLFSRSVVLEKQ